MDGAVEAAGGAVLRAPSLAALADALGDLCGALAALEGA